MNAEDETNITDIDLLPDGRICVFGMSAEVLELLDQLQGGADDSITERLDSVQPPIGGAPRPVPAIARGNCDA